MGVKVWVFIVKMMLKNVPIIISYVLYKVSGRAAFPGLLNLFINPKLLIQQWNDKIMLFGNFLFQT